jgi:hypothetical protein
MSLHCIHSKLMDLWLCHRPNSDIATSATTPSATSSLDAPLQDLAGYPRIVGIIDLRPLFEVGTPTKAFLRSALPDSLQLCSEIWVSLHFVRSRPCLSFSSIFDHHTGHSSRHDTQILLMSASSMPSEFFHHHFDLLEACFL